MASRYYESRHGVIHYDRRGLGDPVLLVHGIYPGASHAEFTRTAAALQRSCTVYSVDLLGFGGSAAPRITHSAQLHQHLLRDFLNDEVAAPAHIIASGLSNGVAIRLGVYDDPLVNKLVLICPVSRVEEVREEYRLGSRISQFILGTLSVGNSLYETAATRVALEQFLHERYYDPASVTADALDGLEAAAHRSNAMLPYISLLNGYFDVDCPRWLRYVHAETLVIWGEGLGPPPEERLLAPAVWSKGKRIELIARARHWPHDERSAAVNALLIDFLAEGNRPSSHGA